MKLDDMVREFREYAEGKNGYDELDFKADLLAWHREEVEKMLPKEQEFMRTHPEATFVDGYNTAIREMKDKLSKGDVNA